jgi:hypothetical protein
LDISGSEFSDRKIIAGKIMPPNAAMLGRAISLICVISLRSCSPIKKKNGARISLWVRISRLIGVVKQV